MGFAGDIITIPSPVRSSMFPEAGQRLRNLTCTSFLGCVTVALFLLFLFFILGASGGREGLDEDIAQDSLLCFYCGAFAAEYSRYGSCYCGSCVH